MSALAAARNTQSGGSGGMPPLLSVAISDNVKCYEGGIIVASAGYAQPATAATGLVCLGRALKTVDNTVAGHALGALQVPIERGQFWYGNSAGGDAIAAANRYAPCYLVDDQTVALTDSNGARSLAGTIIDVSSTLGVLVEMGVESFANFAAEVQYPQFSWTFNVPALSALANAQNLLFTPGIICRVKSIQFTVETAVTTGAKAATITPAIGPVGGAYVSVTGGALALTSANCTPIGANVAGAAITALNTMTAAQQLSLVVSGVTAFAEGAGQITVVFG